MALNEITPARNAAGAGRKRVRIDWKRGASLLIDGETPTAVCTALGIDEDRLWRHLRGSLRFQYLLRQARERRQLLGQLKFEAASREAAVRLARSAEKPDAGLIAELAGTGNGTGNGAGNGTGPQDERRDVIARLAESGRRPPNQAFRKRLAIERQRMDAEFERIRRATIIERAVRDAARQGSAAQAADKTSKPENKTQISENKHDISADKPVQAAAETPALPRRVPPAPLSMQNSGAVVDLTDIYGNPLPGVPSERTENGTPARADAWPG